MGGGAGVEQGREDLVHGALELVLQGRLPLCGLLLCAVGAGVGHRQVGQDVIHLIFKRERKASY